MPPIGSRSHPAVSRFRETRDGRDDQAIFVEGRRLLEELLDSSVSPREAAVTPAAAKDPRNAPLVETLQSRGATVHIVTPFVMEFLSDLDCPPGLAVRADKPQPFDIKSLCALNPPSPLFVLLDALQSPANVGAILRSAEAAGVTAVGLLPNTADPLSPKALRASAGGAFRVPLFFLDSAQTLQSAFGDRLSFFAADAGGPRSYEGVDWSQPSVLLLGGEARGVAPLTLGSLSVEKVRIPMAGRVESLNVAVAAGILLMEARRQRTSRDSSSSALT
ncbi:MAG: RNA methyltransferase [Elusimicrobia bacterium]|jgi:TrmH family RNA methyltransferase|nr:RNA methyltransferase [Elusimicrobiota bacterium]